MESLPMLDTDQLSELIHISPATLRFWRHMDKGPKYFRMGGRKVFYHRSDVEKWLEQQYAEYNSPVRPVA